MTMAKSPAAETNNIIAIVFAVLQRHFFKGIEEGGVKG